MKSGLDAELFGNAYMGLRYHGYNEYTETAILNAGGMWNYTYTSGYGGPHAPALTMKSDVWQHIAIVHDDTALTTTIYVDGVDVGSVSDIKHPDSSGGAAIHLGNTWSKINGSIKDFRIWDVARATEDLNVDIDGTEAGLELYFPLDKVGGVKFKDATGNYDGEMRGIKWNKVD